MVLLGGTFLSAEDEAKKLPDGPTRFVTDTTRTFMSAAGRNSLNAQLLRFHDRTKHHVLVYITEHAHGDVDDYCAKLFNAWGIGRREKDDGLVLFIFVNDKRGRIVVGYGLQRAVPEREAVRIWRDTIAPLLKTGQNDQGITIGMDEILGLIDATAG